MKRSSMNGRAPARAVLAAAFALAPVAAYAFTMQDGDASKWSPKFNIEEQAKNFSTSGADTKNGSKREFETPVGKFQFGVQQTPLFGSPFQSDTRAYEDRQHFNGLFDPDRRLNGGR